MLPINSHDRHKRLNYFISSCDLPKPPREAIEFTNAPIISEEVEKVLKLLPSGKSPSPDRLAYLYYQIFSEQLVPCLHALYNPFLERGPISNNML